MANRGMVRAVEREILVQGTREPSDSRMQALAGALHAEPHWQAVLSQARLHGVLPLLHATLTAEQMQPAIPQTIWHEIELGAALTSLKNASLLHALQWLYTELQGSGITPLVLKGPALATRLYADVGLRPFSDLDLLVPADQMAAADRVLRGQGYRAVEQKPWEQDHFHIVYGLPDAATIVELHSDLLQLGLPTRCLPALWQAAESSVIGGVPMQTLGLEHLLLHLCVHLHTHGYGRLIWFKDLDLLLRASGEAVDWPRLWQLAQAEGTVLSIRHALRLVQLLLETPLPAAALGGPRAGVLSEVAHAALWPERHVLRLQSKQRLRSLRFNPRLGVGGMLPNLVVMGRRRAKLMYLVLRTHEAASTHNVNREISAARSAVKILPPTEHDPVTALRDTRDGVVSGVRRG